MLDRSAAESPDRAGAARSPGPSRDRRRALVACAVLVLVLHAAFIGRIGGLVPGSAETSVAPMSLRTPDAALVEGPGEATPEAMAESSVTVAPAVAPPPPAPRTTRPPR